MKEHITSITSLYRIVLYVEAVNFLKTPLLECILHSLSQQKSHLYSHHVIELQYDEQGYPFSCKYLSIFNDPKHIAEKHASESNTYPFSCIYFKQSKFFSDIKLCIDIKLSHEQLFSYAYLRQSKCPFFIARVHASSSHGHPFSCAYLRQFK